MPRRRSVFASLLVLVTVASGAYWAQRQVPDFYQEALVAEPDPVKRQAAAKTFVQRTLTLIDDLRESDAWAQQFEEAQVNAWLAEELHAKYGDLVPPEVSEPRVRFVDGAVLLGFRYSGPDWDGVVSLTLEPRVDEPNRLSIEIASVQAGLIPIPLDTVTERISQRLTAEGWQAEWREADGHDVLVVELDRADDVDHAVLETVAVAEGKLLVAGSRKSAEERESELPPDESGASDAESPQLADQDGDAERN